MSEFDDIRGALNTAHDEAHGQARRLFRLRQRLSLLQRERERRRRRSGPLLGSVDDPALADLNARIGALEEEIGGLRARLAEQERLKAERFARFADFTDPRRQIERLSDRTPILLLPLRLETRFKRAEEFAGRSDELWVRVYPDDIAVEAFEDTVSENEAQRARTYWADIWRAGGREPDERGAWRTFLSGQGSGRSFWVIEHYRPLNADEKPLKPDGVPALILAIVTQMPLAEPEKARAGEFWEALWRAGDDAQRQAAAVEALAADVGPDRAEIIRRDYRPRNLDDPPPAGATRDQTSVSVAFLEFPDDAELGAREAGWAQAPHTSVLPDRLVLLGYNGGELELEQLGKPIPSPLVVAPDPSAEQDEQIRPDGDEIRVGEEMRWVTDFERAIEVGMGFRVPMSEVEFRRGFDTLMVLGLRLRADAAQGQQALEELIAHHQASKAGFEILPQGRPTNNVEGDGAAYSWREDSDVSFDHYFGAPADDPDGRFEKRDGRWLANMLGLAPAKLRAIPFYGHTDVRDAQAMNVALWPATLGYFMDSMLHPVFDDSTVERTRRFFTRHVTARGHIPALRVGRQPYGILPATPRSRIGWLFDRDADAAGARDPRVAERRFLRRLYALLRAVEADFEPLMDKVSYIGKPGADPHQVLLDVLGLHPGSVEFQQRYAESFQQLYNRLAMQGSGGALVAILIALGYVRSGLDLLEKLGYQAEEGAEMPDILEKLFLRAPNQLKGGLIDDQPLSETAPIRAYTEGGDNYIAWLIGAAGTSHDALRLQKGFASGTPTALLYLMLHHALDLSFVETSVRLFFNAGLIDQTQLKAAKREPKFVQVQESTLADPVQAGGSRWQYLYRRDAAVVGATGRTIGEFIPTVLTSMTATDYLKRQLDALALLEDRPTAALERAFAEHLDLCTYRFDAWYGGLLDYQLEEMRFETDAEGQTRARPGLYLGAYGWLEDVKPEFKQLTPVDGLPPEVAKVFDPTAEPPLVRDNRNQGYIHAPSLNHAVTAAVLRNGYLSNATPANPGSLAVNLTSERVRMALGIIEGMRADQSLGALLGYQFERGLHDRHDVEVDEFIYDLRKRFPLIGDRLKPTRTGKTDEIGRRLRIQRVEARNVVDGLALIEHIKKTGNRTYPFGLTDELPAASAAQAAAISEEAERIANLFDAVADLAMAESVHQVVQGNYDRAGAVLDTYAKGKFPDTPDVVRTPRSGVTLTHRATLHLETGLDPNDPALTSPRARAEPAINAWLAGLLPAADRVACTVTVTDPADASVTTHSVRQSDLGLLPIDLLYLLDPDDERSGRALDDRIERHLIGTFAPRPDAELAIAYRGRLPAIAGHVPFFELAALIRPLRTLLLRSRPLRASDMAMSGEASDSVDADETLSALRITLPRDALAGHVAALDAFQATLQANLDAAAHAQIATGIEQTIAVFAGLMQDIDPFAGLDTGTGQVFADRRRLFADLRVYLVALIERWNGRLGDFDAAIAAYDAAPTASDEDKFVALQIAERSISTTRTDPLPEQPDSLRNDLVNTRRAAFVAQRDSLAALRETAVTLNGLHDGIQGSVAANAAFDPTPTDIGDQTEQIVILAEDMARRAATLSAEIATRLAAVQAQLDANDAATNGKKKIAALSAAARLLFGDDFQIVPDFALSAAQADEWASAWGSGPTADRTLLGYLENDLGRRFPVDDWFAGIARVRNKMHELESAMRISEAFGATELALQPLQFPHRPETPWLGLEFPETTPAGEPFRIDEDKLLYTGIFVEPFERTRRQIGLLLDEWTEVIPTRTEDTGLAFHYDRPNCEPPQTLLLALPPQFTGSWRWPDLVDTVHETMDLAKKRAIEPDHIDTTAYARLLPALVSAVTLHPITASLNFAFNNNLAAVLAAAEDNGDE